MEYDVVIVGGGPSGATLGMSLARAGVRTLIVDKARFPRNKPCGGLLSPKSVELIHQQYGDKLVGQISLASSTGCQFFYHHQFVAEGAGKHPMHLVSRSQLDAALLASARAAGCAVLEGTRAVAIDAPKALVHLEGGRSFQGQILVGADGANSLVRRSLSGTSWTRRNMGFGLVIEIPATKLRESHSDGTGRDLPQIYFGDVSWGYGWVFPKHEEVCIGVGGLVSRNRDFRQLLKALVTRRCVDEAWEPANVRGHCFPFGNFERRPGSGNICLVGDAAGLAEPITGEGIALALQSGWLAGEAIKNALSQGNPSAAGPQYCSDVRHRLFPQLKQAMLARRLLFPRSCLPRAMRSLRRRNKLVERYFELLAGDLTYGGYFREMVLDRFRRRRGM